MSSATVALRTQRRSGAKPKDDSRSNLVVISASKKKSFVQCLLDMRKHFRKCGKTSKPAMT